MKKIRVVARIMCLLIVASILLASCSNVTDNSKVGDLHETSDNVKYITEYSMQYPPKSIEELVASSELIVRANMVDLMPSEERDGLVVTDHIFEISEVYSGDKKAGEKITVEMLGGTLDDTKYVANGEKEVQTGDEVILILSYPMNENDEISSKDYYVYYPPAGIYYKTEKISEKDGEQFIANNSSYTFDLSTVQSKIDSIKKANNS